MDKTKRAVNKGHIPMTPHLIISSYPINSDNSPRKFTITTDIAQGRSSYLNITWKKEFRMKGSQEISFVSTQPKC